MQLESVVTCPNCGSKRTEHMPENECLYFYICPSCAAHLQPNAGDCCVFCSFGDVRCPSMQNVGSGRTE